MEKTRVLWDPSFKIGEVDPRIFGGFLEPMGRAVYEGVSDPQSSPADENGFRKDVLGALRPVTGGRLCIVLGCGGDRDRAKRPLMGAASARLADVAILTSDNPRSEDPLAILAEMLAGVLTVPEQERARVIIEPDRAAAIGLAVAMAGKGDVVVVAGKGHERGQYVRDSVIPFDDREVAAAAILHHLGPVPPGEVPPGEEPLPWEVQS